MTKNPRITKKQIKTLRIALGETHVEFAKRFERSFSTIKRWESGGSEPTLHEAIYIESLMNGLKK